ncbi:MAG: cell wall hydrolase [Bacteroidota bacterium]
MFPSRRGLLLLTILAFVTMLSFEPWSPEIWRGRGIWPHVPYDPPEVRPAPLRADLPRSGTGPSGPVEPRTGRTPAAQVPPNRRPASPARPVPQPVRPSPAVSAARRAARQRYLDNVYLLGKLIHGEARGEPFVGQVAVGAVVMNRVASPLFPKSIAGVIFEPGAFDAVIDGQIYLPPDQEAIRAAEAAIGGWDPTGGAIYYYNPIKTTSYWIWHRPVVTVIGRHHFAR